MASAQPRTEPSSLPVRVARAARTLTGQDRLAALAAVALLVSLWLPWYQKTSPGYDLKGHLQQATTRLTALGAFTLVEGAVMLIAAAVLVLLFLKAERGRLSLPGRDGTVIVVAGAWTMLLVLFRMFDQPGAGPSDTVGIAWGIFVALLAAAALTTAGLRARAASVPEAPTIRAGSNRSPSRPPRPPGAHRAIGEVPRADDPPAATTRLVVGRRPGSPAERPPPPPDDHAPTEPLPPGDRLF